MKTETLNYKDGDLNLIGCVAYDENAGGKRPAVVIMPDAFGFSPFVKERAERLAKNGWVVMGADPYGNAFMAKDLQEGIKHAMDLLGSPAKVRARVRAAVEKVASLPQVDPNRIGVMGYCMGGTCSLEIARDGAAGVRGVVSFHGTLATQAPANAGKTKAKVLVCHGADDPFVPVAQVAGLAEEMTKAGVEYQIVSYPGVVHSFTNPEAASIGAPGIAYDKHADEHSWKAMTAFFSEVFA
ncbi:MAG TPA: dienelactone hydrolase family protein [Candidatus Binataceae bacterium]|nr:dienelactone hydrolase family protein [Candidatus Binataceae bacterium]